MLYTGIDKHKDNSFLTTVNSEGSIGKQARVRNTEFALNEYFKPLSDGPHRAVVESTSAGTGSKTFFRDSAFPWY